MGELCVSLRYVPSSGQLTVVVLEARGLNLGPAGESQPAPSVWAQEALCLAVRPVTPPPLPPAQSPM